MLMVISNQTKDLSIEGGSFYAEYRFLSHDRLHNHFRMAAYGRISFNNSNINQEAIDLYGYNSGYRRVLFRHNYCTRLLYQLR
jgi:hypothetical protein